MYQLFPQQKSEGRQFSFCNSANSSAIRKCISCTTYLQNATFWFFSPLALQSMRTSATPFSMSDWNVKCRSAGLTMTCNHSHGSCSVLSSFSLEYNFFFGGLKKKMKKYELLKGFLWKEHKVMVFYHTIQILQDY